MDLKEAVAGAGKAAAGLAEKAKKAVVNAVDQNDDGKFDLKDVTSLAGQLSEKKDRLKRETDKKTLCPIFEDDLSSPDFALSKLIRIAPMDKKHAESSVCEGSIGFEFVWKDLRVITVYPDKAAAFGLRFYPDMDNGAYYADPGDRDHYISLDEYFNYLKVARVGELQKIAQDLGARHFRVTYKERKKNAAVMNIIANAGGRNAAGQRVNAGIKHDSSESELSTLEIAAEMEFIGHSPVEPTLVYFKKDPQIQNLISLRMSDNPMTHQVFTLALSNSAGVKIKDAAKIDGAAAAMKMSGDVSFESRAESESRRYFEYEIDF